MSFPLFRPKMLEPPWLLYFSITPHPIHQQILLVPPLKYTQNPTPSRHFPCHLSGPSHHHRSPGFLQWPPHRTPCSWPWTPITYFQYSSQSDIVKVLPGLSSCPPRCKPKFSLQHTRYCSTCPYHLPFFSSLRCSYMGLLTAPRTCQVQSSPRTFAHAVPSCLECQPPN